MTSLEASVPCMEVANLLYGNYPAGVAQQALVARHTGVPGMPGEEIPYVRVNAGSGGRPVMYVHGFSENLVGRLPFAAEMGSDGFDFTMAGENRAPIPAGLRGRRDRATTMQAENNLAVMEAEGLTSGVDIVTHSYGSLVFQKMLELCGDDADRRFGGSRVVMLAPAGLYDRESPLKLTYRAFASLRLEKRATGLDYPQMYEPAARSSRATQIENCSRTLRECLREIPSLRLDYETVMARVGQLVLAPYAEDGLFPYRLQAAALERAMQAGATIMMPTQLDTRAGGQRSYGGEGAIHDDELFSPSRVTGAIAAVLRRPLQQPIGLAVPLSATHEEMSLLAAA